MLDCVFPHDFSAKSQEWINLQHYVIKEKKLSEKEAIRIFYDVIRVVAELHSRNIVHRDLKLGNMAFNRRLRRVCLVNLCLGKQLINDDDLLKDQRGSPAYISPEVLSAKPYAGKPSDLWALGVVLFTMIYGQFPFYDSVPSALFAKIKAVDYALPKETKVSETTQSLIKKLLVSNPKQRLTAREVQDMLETSIALHMTHPKYIQSLQVVPDVDAPHTLTRFADQKNIARRVRTDQNCTSGVTRRNPSILVEILNEPSSSVSSVGVQMTCARYPIAAPARDDAANAPLNLTTRSTPFGTLPIIRVAHDANLSNPNEASHMRQLMMTRPPELRPSTSTAPTEPTPSTSGSANSDVVTRTGRSISS